MDCQITETEALDNPKWIQFKLEPTKQASYPSNKTTDRRYDLVLIFQTDSKIPLLLSAKATYIESAPNLLDPDTIAINTEKLYCEIEPGINIIRKNFFMQPDTVLQIKEITFMDFKSKKPLFVLSNKEFKYPRSFVDRLRSFLPDGCFP